MGVETTSHVFFQCNVVRQVMRKISSWWNVEYLEVNSMREQWPVLARVSTPDSIKTSKVIIEGLLRRYVGGLCGNFRNKILFDREIPEKVLIFDNLVL
ncbi:hypothetical protein Tco_0719223 [Tanacetum coccineum]